MTFALIPAGGQSLRMGRPKLALPLGDRTVLERVVTALRQGGVEQILVVVGPHVPELAALALRAGAIVLLLREATADMRATIEHGLDWLEERFHPRDSDSWLLVPADHPTLDPLTVRQVLAAYRANPRYSLVIPTYQGQRGHPTLIAWKHVAAIRTLPSALGLNSYLRQHMDETFELPVDCPDILCDLDTPEDYEALLRQGGY